MVSLSNNTQGNVNITTKSGANVNLKSNNDTDVNANTNGNSQRAKSWAVGEGLIDGVDYSAKYYAAQAKVSEEIAERSIQSEDNAHIWAEGTDEEVQALGGEHSSKGWVDYVMENAPTAEIEQTETGATITVTDIHGTTTADILNGAKGDKGDTGAQGEQGIQGAKGDKGDKGNGISNVSKISTVGLVDTYRMLYTNGSYFDYTVTNGANGTGSVADVQVNGVSVLSGNVANIDFDQTFDGTSQNAQSGVAIQNELSTNYLTTDTAQDVSGRKTFLGEKAIYFKQITTSNKLGFTLYNPSNTELGALEYRPNTISSASLLALNCPQATGGYVGFRYWGTPAVNIVAPKVATAGNYFIPTHITDGTNTVTASNTGTVNINTLLPDVSNFVTNSSLATTLADYVTNSALTTTLSDYALQSDIPDISTKQDTLVSGTNIKTINNTSILGSGNIDTNEVKIVNRTTSFSDLQTLFNQNKILIYYSYNANQPVYNYLSYFDSNKFVFTSVDNNIVYTITCDTSGWSMTKKNLADTSLSNLSTTGQAVIDGKADTDLSNLSTTGKKVLYSKPTISRIAIATEASQHKDIRTYSLANYLPNDGSDYLVQISCRVVTASTSGTFMNCNLTSSLQTNGVQFCTVRTRSNSFVEASGCGWMLIGSDRKLYHNGSDSTNYKGTYDIQAMAYIRVGSNS